MWPDCCCSPTAKTLFHGQIISVLIAGTGVFATILSETTPNANFPLLMSFCNYFLLSLFLLRKQRSQAQQVEVVSLVTFSDDPYDREEQRKGEHIPAPPSFPTSQRWWYVLAAILDVEANFLVILAYNYTSITSVMLLDCFTIPCAMLLSYLFLGCRYTSRHVLGTAICLSGLVCIVFNDSLYGSEERGSSPVLGDVMCLCGALLYAASNVLQEGLVKYYGRDAFIGHLGFFGMLISIVQCMAVDLPGMRRARFTWQVILSIGGFVSCLFFMYVNTSAFLVSSDAILFNLSLLTSDVYAVLFTFFYQGYLVPWLYFLSFALVILGLALYHTEKPPMQVGSESQSGVGSCPGWLRHLLRGEGSDEEGAEGERKNIARSGNSSSGPSRFEYNPIGYNSSHGEAT